MAAEALVTQFNDRSVGACPPSHTVGENYNANFFINAKKTSSVVRGGVTLAKRLTNQ